MITLENFINLCNLEGTYCAVSVEEKENCWDIHFISLPISGKRLYEIEKYFEKNVKNVIVETINDKISFHIEVE